MKLGFLTAPFPDTSLGDVADWQRSTVHTAQQSLPLEHDQVLANRLVRDVEVVRNLRGIDTALGPKHLHNCLLPLG